MDFSNLDLFGGPLQHVETYVYYDGPRTFAMRSIELGLYYVFNAVEENEETGESVFLVAAMNQQRFEAMRSGVVAFRSVFDSENNTLQTVSWYFDDEGRRLSKIDSAPVVPDDWLPARGARLSLKTQTGKGFTEKNLVLLSQAQGRTVFALELESEFNNITELPIRTSGLVQIALGGEYDALVREVKGIRPDLHREIGINFLEVQAASFVMVMAVDRGQSSLLEPTEITSQAFEKLANLIRKAGTGDRTEFIDELRKHTAKVRNRFRDIITPLAAIGSGLTLSTVIADTRFVVRSEASPSAVRMAVEAIDNAEARVDHVDVHRGVLIGFNMRTKRFELFASTSGKTYRGYIDDAAQEQADGLPVGSSSYVRALVRVETPFASESEDTGEFHYIERIEAID